MNSIPWRQEIKKVKILTDTSPDILEYKVNDFLEHNSPITIDVKFQVARIAGCACEYSALIYYRDYVD